MNANQWPEFFVHYMTQYFEILGFYILFNFAPKFSVSHSNDSTIIIVNLLLVLECQLYDSQYFEILGLCLILEFSLNLKSVILMTPVNFLLIFD